jgi:FkbM family methyltransferase
MFERAGSVFPAIHLLFRHPLTRRRLPAALLRVLSWQLKARRERDVSVDWVENTRLVMRRGMTGATGNIYCGLHEYSDMGFLLHFLRPRDLFVDVGANVGCYTVLASAVAGARTIAIEPVPATLEAMRRNLSANAIEDMVTVIEAAAGDRDGLVRMTGHLDTMNFVTTDSQLPTIEVRQLALDSLACEPAIMKLDLEGHEPIALKGAHSTLDCPTLKALVVEFHDEALSQELEKRGFARFSYDPRSRAITSGTDRHFGYNSLYLRDLPFVTHRVETAKPVDVYGQRI